MIQKVDNKQGKSFHYDNNEVYQAFRASLSHMISDSFHLTPDETSWVTYKFGEILQPYARQTPKSIPAIVSAELSTKKSSRSLSSRKAGSYLQNGDTGVPTTAGGWINVIYENINSSYELHVMEQAELKARLNTLFEELGVGSKKNPRAALYLPSVVRYKSAHGTNPSLA